MAMLQSISKIVDSDVTNIVQADIPVTELEEVHVIKIPQINQDGIQLNQLTSISKDPEQTPNLIAEEYPQDSMQHDKSVTNKLPKQCNPRIPRKSNSAPVLSTRQNDIHFDNPAFEPDLDTTNMRFADVVSMLISDPLKADIHPFGRGNLYRTALDGPPPSIYHDNGKLFIWAITTIIILGIVGSAVLMSIMYEPEKSMLPSSNTTLGNPTE